MAIASSSFQVEDYYLIYIYKFETKKNVLMMMMGGTKKKHYSSRRILFLLLLHKSGDEEWTVVQDQLSGVPVACPSEA